MKKLLCFMFCIFAFMISFVSVKAITIEEDFDYNKCNLNCSSAGSNSKYCMAECSAKNYIKENQPNCTSDECYRIKYNYYLDFYDSSNVSDFNYSTFDYVSCKMGCTSNSCNAYCDAREDTRKCILKSYSNLQVDNCKNNYEKLLNDYNIKYGVISGNDNKDDDNNHNSEALNRCSKECSKKCENEYNPSECVRYCYNDCVNFINNPPEKIQCGDFKVPYIFAQITSTIVTILKIATPIIVILLGSIDFAKGVIAQKEDEIKKGQQIFIRRVILGILVFLVFVIVQLVIGLVAPNDANENMWNCVDCMINGKCN